MASRARLLCIWAAILVCPLLVQASPSFDPAQASASSPGWAQGPVWYIMTSDEYRSYRRLHSDTERSAFIRSFWDLRDPLPDTPENELEREFWHRVRLAEENFSEGIKPGWKTERGKLFILLGPPENMEEDRILEERWETSAWLYDLSSLPPVLRDVLQESLGVASGRRFVKVDVHQETQGTRSLGRGVTIQKSVLRPTGFLPLADNLVRKMPRGKALRQLGHLMLVPEVLERYSADVQISTLFRHVPVEARIDFRPAQPDGVRATTVAVTVGVRQEDLRSAGAATIDPGNAILTGYLTSVEDETISFALTGSFQPDPAPERGEHCTYVFQSVARIPPGRYLLTVSFQDPGESLIGAVRDFIEVPVYGTGGLTVSSLVLSSRLDRLETAQAQADPLIPFRLGPYRVIPRTTQEYSSTGDLTVFYEVFGARLDGSGHPHMDIDYQFYLEDEGVWLPIGAKIRALDRTDAAQAWRVPLGGLPPGRYRLEISVTDTISQMTAVRGTFFEIVARPRVTSLR